MAVSKQKLLQEAWLSGREGTMSAQTQARAWALREAWRDEGNSDYGMCTHIASKLYTIAPPKTKKEHPSAAAIQQLFQKIDQDKAWFPGKSAQVQYGPAPAINGTNQSIIARSAMNLKEKGKEPTYSTLVAHNPEASKNPTTNRPVDKKQLYKLLKKLCYDDAKDPEDKWVHDYRNAKSALTEDQMKARLKWAKEIPKELLKPQWCFKNLIWTDICNSILPRIENKHKEQVLARKGRKGWGSKKTKKKSKNLQGNKPTIKQKSWGTLKVWWAPMLSRGKLHIQVLGKEFPGEIPSGAAILAEEIRKVVNIRFQGADQPKILFVDRGKGFWQMNSGTITKQFKAALKENSLKAYYGENASSQPGNLQEVMLHETAVAWIRLLETKTRPKEPWKESVDAFTTRMQGIAKDINKRHRVDNLCKALPKRLKQLVENKGDRINQYSAYQRANRKRK